MRKATSETSEVKLRSKSQAMLATAGVDEKVLCNAVVKLKNKDEEEILEILWIMSFASIAEYGLRRLHLTTGTGHESYARIPDELVRVFRNELRYQCTRIYPNLLDVVPKRYEEAYKKLLQEMGEDEIVCAGIFMKMDSYLRGGEHNLDRTSGLLHHSEENNYFGGLRAIGFTYAEANELKSSIEAIATFFESLVKVNLRDAQEKNEEQRWYPFWNLSSLIEERGDAPEEEDSGQVHEDKVTDNPSGDGDSSKTSTTEASMGELVLQNQELFRSFIRNIGELKEIGCDIDRVLEQLPAIQALLTSFEVLK